MIRPGDLVDYQTWNKEKGKNVIRRAIVKANGRSWWCIHGHFDLRNEIVSKKDIVRVVKKQLIPASVIRKYLS